MYDPKDIIEQLHGDPFENIFDDPLYKEMREFRLNALLANGLGENKTLDEMWATFREHLLAL